MNPEYVIGWIIVALLFAWVAWKGNKSHFICPKCGSNFKVNIGMYIFSSSKVSSKHNIKCPICGYYGGMEPYYDKNR
jgi:DNA-directed RNA polymerase subunit RPC12/RpoP